jgi:hypothetical protein
MSPKSSHPSPFVSPSHFSCFFPSSSFPSLPLIPCLSLSGSLSLLPAPCERGNEGSFSSPTAPPHQAGSRSDTGNRPIGFRGLHCQAPVFRALAGWFDPHFFLSRFQGCQSAPERFEEFLHAPTLLELPKGGTQKQNAHGRAEDSMVFVES